MKTFTEKDIVYETNNFSVRYVDTGHYEIYQENLTHAVRVGTVHYNVDPQYALDRAIIECDKRQWEITNG